MNPEFIQKRIKELINEKDLSEREVSMALGQAHSYIHNICSGTALPSIPVLLNICDYFNLTPAMFFEEDSINFSLIEIFNRMKRLSEYEISVLAKVCSKLSDDDIRALILVTAKLLNE